MRVDTISILLCGGAKAIHDGFAQRVRYWCGGELLCVLLQDLKDRVKEGLNLDGEIDHVIAHVTKQRRYLLEESV